MSAATLTLFNRLRKSGVADNVARPIAEALETHIADLLREQHRLAEQAIAEAVAAAVAEAVAKTRAEAVPAGEYHRRMENTPTRDENKSQFAELKGAVKDLWAAVRELQSSVAKLQAGQDFNSRILVGIAIGVLIILIRGLVGV